MSQPTDSLDVKDLKDVSAGGLVREDVLDQIFGADERGTPFLEAIGEGTFSNNYSEWLEEDLLSGSTSNTASSGSDYTPTTSAHGTRIGNHAQINRRGVNVTDRAQEVEKIGRSDELGYESMRQIQALRYDQEKHALSQQASIADNPGTTVGKSAGFDAVLKTNTSFGDGGADGGFNTSTKVVDTVTAGAARGGAWSMISDQIENCFVIGSRPNLLMSVPAVTKRLGQYLVTSGRAADLVANVNGTQGETMVSNSYVDSFKTDFGFTMRLVPNWLQDEYAASTFTGEGSPIGSPQFDSVATVFGVDPAYVQKATLYGVRVSPLARNGDYVRKLIQEDWMLKVTLERAHFAIRDLTPNADWTD